MRRRLLGLVLGVGSVTVVAAAALVFTVFTGAGSAGGNKHALKATLSGYQEVPPIFSSGKGTFTATITKSPPAITYTLTYSGLSTAATAAHIHFADHFEAGSVVVFICGGGGKPACPAGPATVTGTIHGSDVLNVPSQGITAGSFDELVALIRAGVSYVNVHSTNFPAGEIRGQITTRD